MPSRTGRFFFERARVTRSIFRGSHGRLRAPCPAAMPLRTGRAAEMPRSAEGEERQEEESPRLLVRIVVLDHYLAKPCAALDVCLSDTVRVARGGLSFGQD